jgi:hypothetical protein
MARTMKRYDAFFIKLKIIVPTGSIVSGALVASSIAAMSIVFFFTTTAAGDSFVSI